MKTLKTLASSEPGPEAGFMGAGSGSLFAEPAFRRSPVARRRPAPELVAARVLCNQLKRKRASADKRRLAHLICLNLLAALKRRS